MNNLGFLATWGWRWQNIHEEWNKATTVSGKVAAGIHINQHTEIFIHFCDSDNIHDFVCVFALFVK